MVKPRKEKKRTTAAPVDLATAARALSKVADSPAELAISLKPVAFLPTGMRTVDMALSGGIPYGRITQVWGDSSTGKTALALWVAAQHLRRDPEATVVYIDTERAISGEFVKLLGLDMNRIIVVSPETVEACFETIEMAIYKLGGTRKVLVVWDSVAASISKAESEDDYDSKTPAQFARAMSRGMKKIRPIVCKHGAPLLVLNQLRTQIGQMFGDPKKACGGLALTFHTDLSFRLYRTSWLRPCKGADPFGIQVRMKMDKTRVGLPARECMFRMYFTLGQLTDLEEVYDMAKRYGLGEKAGNGVVVCGQEFASRHAFAVALRDDPVFFDGVLESIQRIMFPPTCDGAVVMDEE